jgi:hypothetical protein
MVGVPVYGEARPNGSKSNGNLGKELVINAGLDPNGVSASDFNRYSQGQGRRPALGARARKKTESARTLNPA